MHSHIAKCTQHGHPHGHLRVLGQLHQQPIGIPELRRILRIPAKAVDQSVQLPIEILVLIDPHPGEKAVDLPGFKAVDRPALLLFPRLGLDIGLHHTAPAK